MSDRATKTCAVCGRDIEWRRKWARDWDSVRYCSASCRARKNDPMNDHLERAILELLQQRDPGATICPSEAARAVDRDNWRDLMEPARQAARRLAHEGRLQITQKGRPVDPADFKGPIRLRLPA